MCRIWGCSIGNDPEEIPIDLIAGYVFPQLVVGGPHAYGWMTHNGDGEIIYDKHVGRCDTSSAINNIVCNVDPEAKWFVGHTRLATVGSPDNENNNHPVLHGNIIGVHNGTIINYQDVLERTGRQEEGTEVDSEAIFAAVHKWGPKKGLARLEGRMVAVYAHINRPTNLYLARSYGKHITLGWTERGNLFFASERSALFNLEPEIRFVRFSEVQRDRLLVIRNGKIINRLTYRMAPKPVFSEDDLAIYHLLQAKAQRRGHKLFERRNISENLAEDAIRDVVTVEHEGEKIYYYKGVFYSEAEWTDFIVNAAMGNALNVLSETPDSLA